MRSAECEITALETVPIGDAELFDLVLNCYEKLFQYSHFQSDISPVSRPAAFVLFLRGVMSGRALIYTPYSQFSVTKKKKRKKERQEKKKGGEASEARDLGS